jgi:chromosome segregation ATPase
MSDQEIKIHKDSIQAEISQLNAQYKSLVHKRQALIKELQGVEEEMFKKAGAYQALKQLLDKAGTADV